MLWPRSARGDDGIMNDLVIDIHVTAMVRKDDVRPMPKHLIFDQLHDIQLARPERVARLVLAAKVRLVNPFFIRDRNQTSTTEKTPRKIAKHSGPIK